MPGAIGTSIRRSAALGSSWIAIVPARAPVSVPQLVHVPATWIEEAVGDDEDEAGTWTGVPAGGCGRREPVVDDVDVGLPVGPELGLPVVGCVGTGVEMDVIEQGLRQDGGGHLRARGRGCGSVCGPSSCWPCTARADRATPCWPTSGPGRSWSRAGHRPRRGTAPGPRGHPGPGPRAGSTGAGQGGPRRAGAVRPLPHVSVRPATAVRGRAHGRRHIPGGPACARRWPALRPQPSPGGSWCWAPTGKSAVVRASSLTDGSRP